jgi:hypothetical protein
VPGIEFLPDEPGRAEVEELLESAPRHRLPRWLIAVVVALVAIAAVIVTVGRGGGSAQHPPVAAPSSSEAAATPSTRAEADDHLGAPLAVGGGRPVLDVAVAGETSWVLQARQLQSITRLGVVATARIPAPSLIDTPNEDATLVLDIPAGVLWIVAAKVKPARILEYDIVRLRLMRAISGVGFVNGEAALDGHLYLTTGGRIVDVAPGRLPVGIGTARGTFGPIVADPARDRLLVSDYGTRTRVWPVTPNDTTGDAVGKPATVNVTKASLAVADGAIWLSGFDTGHGVLMRLDPRTLRPTLHSSLDPLLEPGAVLVAGGVVVVWVRDGDGRQLRCVDAATGGQLQSWLIEGPVASGGASALVATSTGAVPLELANCSG